MSETSDLNICEYCDMTGIPAKDAGTADHCAFWADDEGRVEREPMYVCAECLDAGSDTGPGFIAAETREEACEKLEAAVAASKARRTAARISG